MVKGFGQRFVSALLSFVLTVLPSIGGAGAQTFDQDPGHSNYLVVGDVKFSCPKGFACKRNRTAGTEIYIPHRKYDLELIVAIAYEDGKTAPIEQMARVAASHLFPNEHAQYSWKQLSAVDPISTGKGASKFEIGSGVLHGFNGQQRIIFQFRKIRVKEKEVIVGYLFGLGRGDEAKASFDQNLWGDSMPGWYAEAHIIASLTGEKYTDINPGTEIIIRSPAQQKN